MNDTNQAIATLLTQYMAQEAKISALTEVVTTLIARHAAAYDDADEYIMTILAPVHEFCEALDPTDPDTAPAAQAVSDLAIRIETNALGRVQR